MTMTMTTVWRSAVDSNAALTIILGLVNLVNLVQVA